ncbi:MAG: hypothetical protein OXT67_11845, partial [Zetaproteobacteria bacterium]|nr:hypothetical protein [Zetaproteobacteria bacterium]
MQRLSSLVNMTALILTIVLTTTTPQMQALPHQPFQHTHATYKKKVFSLFMLAAMPLWSAAQAAIVRMPTGILDRVQGDAFNAQAAIGISGCSLGEFAVRLNEHTFEDSNIQLQLDRAQETMTLTGNWQNRFDDTLTANLVFSNPATGSFEFGGCFSASEINPSEVLTMVGVSGELALNGDACNFIFIDPGVLGFQIGEAANLRNTNYGA